MVVGMKSSQGDYSGMKLGEIKVLLSYLVCSIANAANVIGFTATYTTTCRKLWEAISAFVNTLLQHLQLLYETGITLPQNENEGGLPLVCAHMLVDSVYKVWLFSGIWGTTRFFL